MMVVVEFVSQFVSMKNLFLVTQTNSLVKIIEELAKNLSRVKTHVDIIVKTCLSVS